MPYTYYSLLPGRNPVPKKPPDDKDHSTVADDPDRIYKRSVVLSAETERIIREVQEVKELNLSAAIRMLIKNHGPLYARGGKGHTGPTEGHVYVEASLWAIIEPLSRRLGVAPQSLVLMMIEEHWRDWLKRAEEREANLKAARKEAEGRNSDAGRVQG